MSGDSIKASQLFRVRSGQFLYARLNAYEGAFGVVSGEFDQHFVSNEFPIFNCKSETVLPEFLLAYFKSPQIWAELKRSVTGIGGGAGNRRIRLKESDFLKLEIFVPPLDYQQSIKDVLFSYSTVRKLLGSSSSDLKIASQQILSEAINPFDVAIPTGNRGAEAKQVKVQTDSPITLNRN